MAWFNPLTPAQFIGAEKSPYVSVEKQKELQESTVKTGIAAVGIGAALAAPTTLLSSVLSKISTAAPTTAVKAAVTTAAPTITTAVKTAAPTTTKTVIKSSSIKTGLLGAAGGFLAATLLGGGSKQEQQQQVDQTAGPQQTAPQTTIATPTQTTSYVTYSPQTTRTESQNNTFTQLLSRIEQSGSGFINLAQTPTSTIIPTTTVTPTSSQEYQTSLETALTPIQAQLQELLSGQTQEATQETINPLILIAVLAVGAYFLLGRNKNNGS